jgi:hypothetical protein
MQKEVERGFGFREEERRQTMSDYEFEGRCVWTGKGKTRRRSCGTCAGYVECERPEKEKTKP